MIELLEVGDRVATGSYHLLSRFRGATAFVGDESGGLAVVVEESQGAGPAQIVVRGDFHDAERLEVSADGVMLDGFSMEIRRRYCSRLDVRGCDPARMGSNLMAFGTALRASAPGRSLVFASDSGSGFEAAVARRFQDGVSLLLGGDTERGARAIAGLGFGLTPSGDDFLAGFLLGLYARGAPEGQRRRLFEAARSPNPFSESLLECALEGCCIEAARWLIEAIFAGAEGDVVRHTERLSKVGASSGADLAAGVYCVLGGQANRLPHKDGACS